MATGAMRRIGPESTRRVQSKAEVGNISVGGSLTALQMGRLLDGGREEGLQTDPVKNTGYREEPNTIKILPKITETFRAIQIRLRS